MATAAAIAAWTALALSVGSAIYTMTLDVPDSGGVLVTKKGTQAGRDRVYGKCRVSCTSVYSNVLDRDRSYRLDVFAVAGIGPLTFHNVWIDDVKMFTTDKSEITNAISSTSGMHYDPSMTSRYGESKNFTMQWRSGQENQVAAQLAVNNSDGEWTTSHKGALVPQIVVYADSTQNRDFVIFGDKYSIVALVTGADLYDPTSTSDVFSDDSTWSGASSNPSLAILDFLTSEYYGIGIDISEYIDLPSFAYAKSYCDSHGLEINAQIDSGASYADTLTDMLSTFGGALSITNGKISILVEETEVALYSFDEDTILKSSFKVSPSSSSDYYNVVSAKYKSFLNSENEDDFVIPMNAYDDLANTSSRIYKDGKIITKKFDMPFSMDAYDSANGGNETVQRGVKFITNREYNRISFQSKCSFEIDLLEYPDIRIWSVISVTNSIYGYTNKLFRVQTMNSSVDGEKFNIATIDCTEYDDSIYSGVQNGANSVPMTPVTQFTSPPLDVVWNQKQFISTGFGNLAWTAVRHTQGTRYDIDYRLTNATTPNEWVRYAEAVNDISVDIYNLKDSTYDFRVRTIDIVLGGGSTWAALLSQEVTPNDSYLPTVTGVTGFTDGSTFVFEWDDMSKADLLFNRDENDPSAGGDRNVVKDVMEYYEVGLEHSDDNITWSNTYLHRTNELRFDYHISLNEIDGSDLAARYIRATVKIVDRSIPLAIKSGASVTDIAFNPQHADVLNLTVTERIGGMLIEWSPNYARDMKGTELHVGSTVDFTPDATTLAAGALLDTESFYTYEFVGDVNKYLKVGHFDVFDQNNINFNDVALQLTYVEPVDFRLIRLDAGALAFKTDINAVTTPSFIDVFATRTNLSLATLAFTTVPANIGTVTGDKIRITSAEMGSNQSVVIEVIATDTDTVEYSDTYTIYSLKDGSGTNGTDGSNGTNGGDGTNGTNGSNGTNGTNGFSALVAWLDNENHSIPYSNTGVGNYVGSGTNVVMFEGTTQLAYNATPTSGQYSVTTNGIGITAGNISGGGNIGDHSDITSNPASVEVTISGFRITGESFSITKIQSISRVTDGDEQRGAGFFKLPNYTGTWSALFGDGSTNNAATTAMAIAVQAVCTDGVVEENDTVELWSIDNTITPISVRFVGSDGANPTHWDAFEDITHGDLLVDGTVVANKLVANTITTRELSADSVTGDEISSATTIIAGSGSSQAGMNGLDTGIYSGWRFWSGGATPSTANFRVDSNGKAYLTGAIISGEITLTDGTEVTSAAFGNANVTADDVGLGNVTNVSQTTILDSASSTSQSQANTAQSTAQVYAAGQASSAQSNAQSYAWNTARISAIGIASSDATNKANSAESGAVNTASADATAKANVAISTASSDATTKANSAESGAVSTASADATTKANSAESGAISTASGDATTKANNAENNAISTAANADKTAGAIAGWSLNSNAMYSGVYKSTDGYSSSGITLHKSGAIRAKNFRIDVDGNAYFKGNIAGSSFNGIRLKIGSFRSTSDNATSINVTSQEGKIYNKYGGLQSKGSTPSFSQLVGVTLSHIGPSTSIYDVNMPIITGTNTFSFDRDNGYSGTQYFSYLAWGV